MKENNLHIICFDNPFPPSYGGAIDAFYRIKALSEAGTRITLHCFYKGDLCKAQELEQLCAKVYYYPRKTTFRQQCRLLPYGVVSRTHPDLLPRLLADDAPILFDGLVSCALMAHPALKQRRKLFRESNVEHDYYHALARATKVLWKKLFFHIEAFRLQRFERCLQHADTILALAHQDEAWFAHRYPSVPTVYVPCFHAFDTVRTEAGAGKPYVLYHGNLAVAENEKAALYIVRRLAPSLPGQVVIAGNHPSQVLRHAIDRQPNVRLIDSPDKATMEQLIREAQVHLLLTFQATGIKLKLLNVLYCGKHVVVNPFMLEGTDLADLCHVGNSDQELIQLCSSLMEQPVSPNELEHRQQVLQNTYNNTCSAQQIMALL